MNDNELPVDEIEDPVVDLQDVSKVVSAGNRFAIDLYHQLRTGQGNRFFSPSSISVAFAMTYAGAKGETERELAKTLYFEMPKEQFHEQIKDFLAYWRTPKKTGIKLRLANRLWAHENYEFLDSFTQVTREKYRAELERLDFTKSEESRGVINQWVADQTENKIADLMPAGSITPDSKLVLTNAVYFRGTWANQFEKDLTEMEDFHLDSSEKIKVPLMNNTDDYGYKEVDGLKVLEMPYGDKSLSMIVLLPKEIDGLRDLESRLTFENFQQWTKNIRSQEVKVAFPKFKTTTQFHLNDSLKALGINSAFNPGSADFSGMTGNKELFIGAAVHKAFVEVNEEGTEAAAATGIVMEATSAMPSPPPSFRADHPFIFMIRDNRNDAILFMGRIENPQK